MIREGLITIELKSNDIVKIELRQESKGEIDQVRKLVGENYKDKEIIITDERGKLVSIKA